MSFVTSVLFSCVLTFITFTTVQLYLNVSGLMQIRRKKMFLYSIVVTVINVSSSILHELAHAYTAWLWGLEVIWGGQLSGQYIQTSPHIYETRPVVQTTVPLAGFIISVVIVALLWRLLITRSQAVEIAAITYVIFTQGIGTVGSLFNISSGDFLNFTQGVSRLTSIRLEVVAVFLLVCGILLLYLITVRVIKSYRKIETLARRK